MLGVQATSVVGKMDTPTGPLRQLEWIDDSSWLGTMQSDIQAVAASLPQVGKSTNLFSDATKILYLGLFGILVPYNGKLILFVECLCGSPWRVHMHESCMALGSGGPTSASEVCICPATALYVCTGVMGW